MASIRQKHTRLTLTLQTPIVLELLEIWNSAGYIIMIMSTHRRRAWGGKGQVPSRLERDQVRQLRDRGPEAAGVDRLDHRTTRKLFEQMQ